MHYSDVIMSLMVSQITGVSIVCPTVWSGTDQRKHQSFASLAFVRPTVTGGFPSQRASKAENVSIWWRHHGLFWVCRLISENIFGIKKNQVEFRCHHCGWWWLPSCWPRSMSPYDVTRPRYGKCYLTVFLTLKHVKIRWWTTSQLIYIMPCCLSARPLSE